MYVQKNNFRYLLLGIVGIAFAADVDWTNGSSDRRWDNAANWSLSKPTSADKAAMKYGAAGPIIDSGTSAVANQVMVGDWSS